MPGCVESAFFWGWEACWEDWAGVCSWARAGVDEEVNAKSTSASRPAPGAVDRRRFMDWLGLCRDAHPASIEALATAELCSAGQPRAAVPTRAGTGCRPHTNCRVQGNLIGHRPDWDLPWGAARCARYRWRVWSHPIAASTWLAAYPHL